MAKERETHQESDFDGLGGLGRIGADVHSRGIVLEAFYRFRTETSDRSVPSHKQKNFRKTAFFKDDRPEKVRGNARRLAPRSFSRGVVPRDRRVSGVWLMEMGMDDGLLCFRMDGRGGHGPVTSEVLACKS